ncbi:hypothetical protein SS50377_20035 [Spironucleus salmonicida]|nr:hypothetical protein SS50377_20035 [Spironucleus salmonicida]
MNLQLKQTLESQRLKTKNIEASHMNEMIEEFANVSSNSVKTDSFRNTRVSAQIQIQPIRCNSVKNVPNQEKITGNSSQQIMKNIYKHSQNRNPQCQSEIAQNIIQFQDDIQIDQVNTDEYNHNSLEYGNNQNQQYNDINTQVYDEQHSNNQKIKELNNTVIDEDEHPQVDIHESFSNDQVLPEDIAPIVSITQQMRMTDAKVKMNQLSEFAHKAFSFARLKDLGNVFLIQSPLKDQFMNFTQLASMATFSTAFPRALRIAPGNNLDYRQYNEFTFLFSPHIHGVSYLELLSGVEKLQSYISTIFVCTNIQESLNLNTSVEMRYFEGLGKNIRYLSSKYNMFNKHFYKYLPVLVKGNYKSQQVEDFCVIFVSFVPPVYYEREIILSDNLQEMEGDEEQLRKVNKLQIFEEKQSVDILPLNCKFYESIFIETQEMLRELGIKMDKNIKFVYLTSQRLTNFDQKSYRIQKEFFDMNMKYDNPNTEFYFDNIINSMDNRESQNYEESKIQQLQLHNIRNFKNQMIQMISFKNMVIADESLLTNSINQIDVKDVKYMEPLMIFIDQCLKLSSGCGMVQDQIQITSFKLFNSHFIRRLNLNIIHDASLVYITNVLKNQIISRYKSQLVPLNRIVNKISQLCFCFSHKTLVGHGPLFDCVDIQHGLDCKVKCQCTRKDINSSIIYVDQISEENIKQFLPGCADEKLGKLFMCQIPLRVLLKSFIYHYTNNVFGSIFNHTGPSFIYYTGIGLNYNSEQPEKSYLFDQYAYKADILRQFQYQNIDGNLLSNIFLHKEKYSTPSNKSAELARLTTEQLDEHIFLILDNGCFEPCGIVQTIKRYTTVVFDRLGHLSEVLKEQISDGVSAQIDLDQCFPACLVSDFNSVQHLLLQQRLDK